MQRSGMKKLAACAIILAAAGRMSSSGRLNPTFGRENTLPIGLDYTPVLPTAGPFLVISIISRHRIFSKSARSNAQQ